jgi:YVTN family beta-propeller protein
MIRRCFFVFCMIGFAGMAPRAARVSAAQTPSPALLVLDKEDSTLSIIDPASLKTLAVIPTGQAPHELTVSSDGKLAFVANYGAATPGDTLSVIDLAAQKEIRRVDLGDLRRPHGIEFVGGKVYFTSEVAKSIGCYDPATNKVEVFLRTDQDRTHMLIFTKNADRIFTANVNSATVSAFRRDPASGKWDVTVIPVGKGDEGMDLSPDGRQLWVANADDGTVSIIDVASDKVLETLDVQAHHSNRLKFSDDGKLALISDMGGNQLIIVDVPTRKVIKRMDIGRQPEGILIPGGKHAYIALGGERTVAVLDLKSLEVTARISTGNGPDGMAWAVRK